MSQNRISCGLAEKGSMQALAASGIRIMSDSLIAFQPAMDEPSNMMPSSKVSGSTVETCWAVCCHLPRGSVNRKSTYSTLFSLIISMTLETASGEFIDMSSLSCSCVPVHVPAGGCSAPAAATPPTRDAPRAGVLR